MIGPFGALQDGGIRANNPTDAALWELNCIWPESNGPNLVLSIGTGHQNPVQHDTGSYRGIWLDGFIPRILRAFLSSPSLDADSSWMALWNRLDDNTRERFHRLSCEFDGEIPALDDSAQIPRLIQMAHSTMLDFEVLKRSLWASRFFFELDAKPQRIRGYYVCRGTIFCRFRDCRAVIGALRRRFRSPKIIMENRIMLDLNDDTLFCQRCGYFKGTVVFEVSHLGQTVSLGLKFDNERHSHLASFPKPMEWFLARQFKDGQWHQWQPPTVCCETQLKRPRRGFARSTNKRPRLR